MNNIREQIKDKKKIVVKIGSSSLQHNETGDLDYIRLEKLVRELCDISNQGKEVVLVTSGAIAVGKKAVNLKTIEGQTQAEAMAVKQACSAIGQARLMMAYQKLFSEYNHVAAQILMTKNTIVDNLNRYNAHNTFTQLLKMGVIPIVNENDTVATYEIEIGDNDTLSAIVAALIDSVRMVLGRVCIQISQKKLLMDDKELPLTKAEYEICEFLAKNRGQVFSKEQILEEVFGFDSESNDSTIITHIKNIRAKFADYDYTPIKTVWGIGYKWEE